MTGESGKEEGLVIVTDFLPSLFQRSQMCSLGSALLPLPLSLHLPLTITGNSHPKFIIIIIIIIVIINAASTAAAPARHPRDVQVLQAAERSSYKKPKVAQLLLNRQQQGQKAKSWGNHSAYGGSLLDIASWALLLLSSLGQFCNTLKQVGPGYRLRLEGP